MKNKTKISDWNRMVSGKLYNSTSKDLFIPHMLGLIRCQRFNKISLWRFFSKKRALEKLIPSAKSNNLTIFTPFYCEYGKNIHVGKGCFINYNCTFLDVSPITLGDEVWIGANVTFATPNHPFLPNERLPKEYPDGYHDLEYSEPIIVNDRCWICSSATICGGVTIGENSIIAAGAVVTEDIPANSIAAGVPAKVLRKIDEDDRMDVWEAYLKNEKPMSIREKRKIEKQL